MRHGRKSSSRLFDGYKTHTVMEEESEFITAVEVTPGNQHDSEAATKLIDAQPKEQQPETIMGDTAYGTGQVRAAMEDKQIKVIAPAPAEPQGLSGDCQGFTGQTCEALILLEPTKGLEPSTC
ncbi:transposase [Desulforamulus profundi]|uniref:transposase n=1 Tax=Desulforamulus profundi TaxID=1383067 RepID=UPI000BFFA468